MIRLLKCNNCYFVEHGAEHDKWFSYNTRKFFRIPRHVSKEIPTGTVIRILKDAGVRKGGN
ncbi:MAG: type II toxin-antitoxin system HicA family toxin [Lachnospiraceae bacterium]|nr:type II toxin-antitoxin system HicA family toxin [Lachnospiraceae bacterium]